MSYAESFSYDGAGGGSDNFTLRVECYDANMGYGEDLHAVTEYHSGEEIEAKVRPEEPFKKRQLPSEFELVQNFPNPFNPSTVIRFSIPSASQVVVGVYDVLGREVELLVNESRQGGIYEVTWDAANCPSGIYYCRLTASEIEGSGSAFMSSRQMILLK